MKRMLPVVLNVLAITLSVSARMTYTEGPTRRSAPDEGRSDSDQVETRFQL